MKKNIFSYKFILYTIIPGLIIGICNAIGYSLHTSNSTRLDSSVFFRFAFYFVLSVAITSGLYLLFDAMPYKSSRLTLLKYIKTSGQYYRIMVAITFLLWLPSYLAVFPGLFTYDARAQWIRVVFNTVTEHHPVIHTLFAGGTIFELQQLTGSIDFGIAVYSILQLIIFSFLVGYWFLVMYQYHIPLFIRVFSLLLITVYPPVVINILSITKDNYYALFFICFILINTQLMFDKNFDFNRKNILLWFIFTEGMLFFRNNSIYAYLLFIPICLFAIRHNKELCKKAVIIMLLSIVIWLLYKYPFTRAVTVEGIDSREKMSIPAQQLVEIYNEHSNELSLEEKTFIKSIIPGDEAYDKYCPYMADITKAWIDTEYLNQNRQYAYNMYFKLMKKWPHDYIDAFLNTNYGLWYLYPHLSYIHTGTPGYIPVKNDYPSQTNSKIPALYGFYKLFDNSNLIQGGAWYSLFFMPALFFYLCLIALFWGIKEKSTPLIINNLYALIMWGTFLLGPTTLIRYVLYLILLIPVNMIFIYKIKFEPFD